MRTVFLSLTFALMVVFLISTSYALDCSSGEYGISIIDIYSDIGTCDITLHSPEELSGLELEMRLEHEGNLLDRKKFYIKSITPAADITKAFTWDTKNRGDGKYTVKSIISKDECVILEESYIFVNGRQTIPRATVDDLVPNSQGFSVIITPHKSVVVDVQYMLIDGTDVIYSGTDKKLSVHTQPMEVNRDWNVLLENEQEYSGRIKVKLYSPSVNYIALTEDFVAQDDVFISDSYEDDIGASATIDGISQVPFRGSVRFTVSRLDEIGEEIIGSVTKRSPVILNGDDETVETIWDERLTTGEYELVIEVIGNDGDILDVEESIIESDYEPQQQQENTDNAPETEQSPGFILPVSIIVILISALFLSRQE